MTVPPAAVPPVRLHPDEFGIDTALVRRLVADQFPGWSHLPIRPAPSGTDNLTYRLGTDLAVRLPRTPSAAFRLRKELTWLPRLAPHLPLSVPVPLGEGEPAPGYPLPWAVVRWIPGESAASHIATDQEAMARDLAAFVAALRRIPAAGGPPPGEHNSGRGVPLAERDRATRDAIAGLAGLIDTDAATDAWSAALSVPPWEGAITWIHGDLHSSNLVLRDGRLAAVVDFGCLGVGDPACDLMVAWTYLGPGTRPLFRDLVGADDASWERGRGWALSVGLIALPYYRGRDAVMETMATKAITAVLDDHRAGTTGAD